ncbi:MAG: aminotransferase class V-fold PLP-dependent enzyme [Phenylobacterium sp.]
MVSRRESLAALVATPLLALAADAKGQAPAAPSPRDNFHFSGAYMNCAYMHPLPLDSAAAMRAYLAGRVDPAARRKPAQDARALFARLINATPDEIAEVPSTSYGESFVVGALGIQGDRRAKVVTDILHFDGSLYTYEELARQGSGLTVLPMTAEGRIDMNRLEAAVDRGTRLVAVSLVSQVNGFEHDLKTVCEIAHRKGALVYVDAVQGAGAVPIDVKASGVDFLACSTFKWLMGDFGYGFLYVRKDLLPKLRRTQFGYHQPKTFAYHAFPGDTPGRALFDSSPNNETAAGLFEVGSLSEASEVGVGVSLSNIIGMGVETIQRNRQPLIEALRTRISARYRPLTPPDSKSSIISFVAPGAAQLRPRIQEAQVNIQLYPNRFRVSPSVFNTMADVDRVCDVILA